MIIVSAVPLSPLLMILAVALGIGFAALGGECKAILRAARWKSKGP